MPSCLISDQLFGSKEKFLNHKLRLREREKEREMEERKKRRKKKEIRQIGEEKIKEG